MIRIELDKKTINKLLRASVAHDRLVVSNGEEDYFVFEVKPSRKGELAGNAKGKHPLFDNRLKITATLNAKRDINRIKRLNV